MPNNRYEINHDGKIVQHESALCANKTKVITDMLSQYGWHCERVDEKGPYAKYELTDANGQIRRINIFSGNVRNESRNEYEKKIQLNSSDPREMNKKDTIILGVYVYEANDSYEDAIFVGYPIDDAVNYPSNPSLRGTFVNKILIEAKTKGFARDIEHNMVGFRAEFIFYYLDNFYSIHYEKQQNKSLETTESIHKGENILLYGVPGCGKSHEIKTNYCNDDNRMERVVFHPDYTYSDFVGQIMPTSVGDNISYPFIPGPFTRILSKAIDERNKDIVYYLVIEEINRGNAPAIFGDIFQLLDRNEAGESEYGITNSDIAQEVYHDKNVKVKIPSNLVIIATMNSSDQNVFTLDTAFKRRWKMRSIKNDVKGCEHAPNKICGTSISWGEFASKMNEIIIDLGKDNLGNEDNRLGAYFVKSEVLDDIEEFAEKVLMYLWNDAVKYNRDKVFVSEYRTLDELINGFKEKKFKVFLDSIGLIDTTIIEKSDENDEEPAEDGE